LKTDRLSKEKSYFLGLFALGVLSFGGLISWYFLGARGEPIDLFQNLNIVAGLPAALLSIPAVFVAFALGLPRFFIYGAVLLVSAGFVILLDLHPGWAFIPSAILGIGLGSTLLKGFLDDYPAGDN